MKRPPKFLVVCAAIVVGLYVAYLVFFPTVYLRYRLTLGVDVDGVTRTGSGVVEIAYPGMPDWLSEIGQGAHFAGEMHGCAITVDRRARVAVCRRLATVFGGPKNPLDCPSPSGESKYASLCRIWTLAVLMSRRPG
jgi:hypothetical protein